MNPAIRTEGLSKRYGSTLALDGLDLTVRRGRGVRLPRPERRRQDDDDPAAARPAPPERRAGRAVRHRRLARSGRARTGGSPTSPGEPFLWPALTSAETLEFLARLHGGTDVAYRDELVERFQLDTRKKVRALSKGNRQKVQLIAALATRADLLLLDEPTSGLDPLMEMAFRECVDGGEGARADGLPVLAHPQRGRGALRPRRDPARRAARRRGHARRAAPPQRADGRGHVRGPRARAAARCRACKVASAGPNALRLRGDRQHRPADRRARRAPGRRR